MKYSIFLRFTAVLIIAALASSCSVLTESSKDSVNLSDEASQFSYVKVKTSEGDIILRLFNNKAPKTVKNFLRYVREGHYKNTIFHRVIKNFMIQGGGFDSNMKMLPTHDPIENEASNGLSNDRGTIAMARTVEPNSARAQFFINVRDNKFLNFKNKSVQGYGYCVFGEVIDGMDVVDKIQNVKTHTVKQYRNVPEKDIVISDIEIIPEPVELLEKIEQQSGSDKEKEQQ
jgi:peptidyl-prolyl cis-trans isomerase B (cyclophilin B)